jgi:hypothetical protein
LEIFPGYVQFKVDFEALLSDKEKLESRLAEIEQWRQRSNSGELQFLLAYVFYQMGELDRAREAINGAYERMPDAPAVVTLKKAIEGRPISENKLRAKPGRGQSPDGVSNEKK